MIAAKYRVQRPLLTNCITLNSESSSSAFPKITKQNKTIRNRRFIPQILNQFSEVLAESACLNFAFVYSGRVIVIYRHELILCMGLKKDWIPVYVFQ